MDNECKHVRTSWDITFMKIAEILAERSVCLKIRTAALIVRDTQIISMGYNGTFKHTIECCDYWNSEYKSCKHINNNMTFYGWLKTDDFKDKHRIWSLANELHAETNALKNIKAKDAANYIMYTLYSPCDLCAKEIISYGIKTIYYKYKYKRGEESLKLLESYDIKCTQII
jgi:dCMP deaminase